MERLKFWIAKNFEKAFAVDGGLFLWQPMSFETPVVVTQGFCVEIQNQTERGVKDGTRGL